MSQSVEALGLPNTRELLVVKQEEKESPARSSSSLLVDKDRVVVAYNFTEHHLMRFAVVAKEEEKEAAMKYLREHYGEFRNEQIGCMVKDQPADTNDISEMRMPYYADIKNKSADEKKTIISNNGFIRWKIVRVSRPKVSFSKE